MTKYINNLPINAFLSTLLIMGCMTTHVFAQTKLDDATIFAIFDQANMSDVWVGRIGAKKGYTEEVRTLAKMVATDHEAVEQMGRDLAKKLGVIPTPPENDSSAANLAKTVKMLQSKAGAEFDKAYLRHELAFHQSVITAIESTLLPAAQHEDLKALINKVLPGLVHHLAETKAVAAKLGIRK